MLDAIFKKQVSRVEEYLQNYFTELNQDLPARAAGLSRSVKYGIFSGGKRFRPTLTLLTAEALEIAPDRVVPFAAAVEVVHSYSLVHDDLPCMDNDEIRRGKPTNHVVHGEAMALLAGDAMITEAPRMIALAYREIPQVAVELIEQLCTAAGFSGMIAGQVMDLDVQARLKELSRLGNITVSELEVLHNLKTGALIRVSVTGVGVIGRVSPELKQILAEFGQGLGLCFQLADDMEDHRKDNPEPNGFPGLIGIDGTRKLLEEVTEKTIQLTLKMGPKSAPLRDLIVYNLKRIQ